MSYLYVDLTEVSILLAINALILLITSQLLPAFYGLAEFTIDKKKLDNAAIVTGTLFLVIISIRIIGMMFSI